MLPSNRKETYHFTYNIEEKCIDLSKELSLAYGGMSRHFDNMPYSFAQAYIHEEDVENFIEAYKAMDRGESFATIDFRMKSPAGWARVCLFRPDFSKPIVSGIVQDVSIRYNYIIAETERKEAEINLRMTKELEALQLMRAVSDSSGMMVSVNLTKNSYYMMNYDNFQSQKPEDNGSYDDLIALSISTIPEEWKDEFKAYFALESLYEAYERGESYVYLEHQQYGVDNQLHWVSTHIMFTENPHTDDVMGICVCRNVDARHKKEEEQKRMLKDALFLAEKANDSKSDFLSRMSHDIRTPMNAIIGMATIAAANAENPDKVKECLSKIGISSRFLLGLINDILDLSKIESGKMSINNEPFSLKVLLSDIESNARDMAKSKQQTFEFSVSGDVGDVYRGDKVRLEQIFMNLLSNANKYTDVGGAFHLNVSYIRRAEEWDIIQFVIEDNGQGISEEFLPRLFDPFTREADSNTRSGSGLGLAIVQNLIHIMDGSIQVETKVGEGSRFIVEIPLRIVDNIDAQKINPNPLFEEDGTAAKAYMAQIFSNKGTSKKFTFQGQHVLVVEDNEFNQEVAKTIMEMHELVVDVAENGYDAVETFKGTEKGHYIAIFMDIQMPGIDGYETTKRLRACGHPDAKTIPIYAMTANAFLTDIDKARQNGMNGHIAKPVDFDKVAQIIADIIQKDKKN